jgi:hypothetical protein
MECVVSGEIELKATTREYQEMLSQRYEHFNRGLTLSLTPLS